MKNPNEKNLGINTSMENPDLDDRPAILRLANIDPAKNTKVDPAKEVYRNVIKDSAKNYSSQANNTTVSYGDSWWEVLKIFIKPWKLATLVLLVIIVFSAFHVYDAIRSKAHSPGCTIEKYERTGECWS